MVTSPSQLEALWEQTKSGYLANQLPKSLKTELFNQITSLVGAPLKDEANPETRFSPATRNLDTFRMGLKEIEDFVESSGTLLLTENLENESLQNVLVSAGVIIFFKEPGYQRCRVLIRKHLLPPTYDSFVDLLQYLKTCAAWILSQPQFFRASKMSMKAMAAENAVAPSKIDPWERPIALEGEESGSEISEINFARNLLNSTHDGILAYNKEFRVIYVNQAMERLSGISRDAIVNRKCKSVFPVFFRNPSHCLDQVMKGHSVRSNMVKYISPLGGRALFFEIQHSPFRESGAIVGGIATVTDVTEKWHAEQGLEDFEKRFRTLFQQTTDLFYTTSPEGIILSLNPAFEAIFGWKPQDWVGKHFMPLVHESDRGMAGDIIARLIQGEQVSGAEIRCKKKDGSLVILEFNGLGQVVDGEIKGLMGIARDITVRRQCEIERAERIREHEARQQAETSEMYYRQLAEAIPQIVWTADSTGKVDYGSARWHTYTGWPISRGFGDGWVNAVHPEDLPIAIESWESCKRHGKSLDIQYRLRRNDGVFRWFLVRGSPLRDKKGNIVRWFGTLTDIDDQKRYEQALEEGEERYRELMDELKSSEARYRMLARATNDCVWDWDLKSNLVERNMAVQTIFGYKPEEVQKNINWWNENIHPDDRKRVVESIHNSITRKDHHWKEEYRYLRKDGTYARVVDRGYIVHDGVGDPSRMVGSMLDVSERRRAEEELRRFKFISDSANDAHFLYGRGEKFLYVNRVACERLGFSETDLLGMSFQDIQPAYDGGLSFENRFENLLNTRLSPFETELVRKDGSRFPAELSVTAVQFEGGSFIFAVARDITERKKAEDELKRKSDRLARSNAELEQFAYVASHDLKEPLRMVNSYLQLLERKCLGKLDKDSVDYFQFAREGAARMYGLIDDLLAYSRVGSRGEIFRMTDSNVAFETAVANLEAAIQESKASISCQRLPTIMADRTQLVQLFQNLLGNAIKFRSHDKPTIEVSAAKVGREWCFSIKDNGIGIAQEYAERIFVIFQRLHTREKYPGTGIGLAICKKILERHGGRIWVAPHQGEGGSTFHFAIPDRRKPPESEG